MHKLSVWSGTYVVVVFFSTGDIVSVWSLIPVSNGDCFIGYNGLCVPSTGRGGCSCKVEIIVVFFLFANNPGQSRLLLLLCMATNQYK